MERTAAKVRVVQAVFAMAAAYLVFDAWRTPEAAGWAAVFLKLGFAMSALSVALSPSVVFGPAFVSRRAFENLPTDQRFSSRAQIPGMIGVLLLLISAVLWVLARVPSN